MDHAAAVPELGLDPFSTAFFDDPYPGHAAVREAAMSAASGAPNGSIVFVTPAICDFPAPSIITMCWMLLG